MIPTLRGDGWRVLRLGDVGRWGSGGTPKRGVARFYDGGDIPWLKIGDLTDGLVSDSEEQITSAALKESSAKLVEPGTLLVAMYGSIGKLGVPTMRCATNQAIAFCVPDPAIATTEYLFELLLFMRPTLMAEGKGGNQSNISQTVLKAIEVPIPPLDAQAEIVAVLRSIRASVASCSNHLRAARGGLGRFRRSVFAAACSGRLTADWRRARGAVDDELPALWQIVTMSDICRRITVGHVGKMVREYREGGVPFLRSLNVRELRFDPSDIVFISQTFHKQLAKSTLHPGDVVVVRSGFVGTACVIPAEIVEANCSDLLIVRPGSSLLPEYAAIYINSPQMKAHIAGVSVGSAQLHFNTKSLQTASIPLPPIEEQHEICRRVAALLATADHVVGSVTTAARHVQLTSQAVVARAFREDLVEEALKTAG